VEGDNESEKAGNAMARKRDGSVDRIWYGIIVETAGNRREQGDGDGDGRRSAGWSSARWRQLSLLVFPWLLRAAATLSRRALLSRANEGRSGLKMLRSEGRRPLSRWGGSVVGVGPVIDYTASFHHQKKGQKNGLPSSSQPANDSL
jgi:hypothetical protein